jgi:hypothetical protein
MAAGNSYDRSSLPQVIVAAGGLLGCISIGAIFSLPVFLQAHSRPTPDG